MIIKNKTVLNTFKSESTIFCFPRNNFKLVPILNIKKYRRDYSTLRVFLVIVDIFR